MNIKLKEIYNLVKYRNPYLKDIDLDMSSIESLNDIYAGFLLNGLAKIDKGGTKVTYNTTYINSNKVKGKIDITKSIKTGALANGRLVCKTTKLSPDNVYNRLIKLAINCLIFNRNECMGLNPRLRGRIIYYKDKFYNVSDEPFLMKPEYRDVVESAPEHYKEAISTAYNIVLNYLSLSKDGNKRLLYLSDDDRVRGLFAQFIIDVANKKFLGSTEVRINGNIRQRKIVDDLHHVSYAPDLIVDRVKDKKYFALDASCDSKNASFGKLDSSFISSEAANGLRITFIADNWNEENIEYSRDFYFNGRTKTYESVIFMNRPMKEVEKSIGYSLDRVLFELNRRIFD